MYICDFSRSVGAGSATTRNTRGLTRSVIALIVPPLPAVSRPSNTMQTLAPDAFTHSCSATSSPCSRRSSRWYSLFFIFGRARRLVVVACSCSLDRACRRTAARRRRSRLARRRRIPLSTPTSDRQRRATGRCTTTHWPPVSALGVEQPSEHRELDRGPREDPAEDDPHRSTGTRATTTAARARVAVTTPRFTALSATIANAIVIDAIGVVGARRRRGPTDERHERGQRRAPRR